MKCNIGKTDKIIRLILGVVIIAVGYYFKCWLGVIGIVLIATALLNWCPLYIPFGINTCKKE